MEASSCNHCLRAKEVRIAYPKYVFVAIVIQHVVHMRHISSVASTTVRYTSTLFHKGHDFLEKKLIEHKIYFYFLYKSCPKHFSF